MKSILKSAFIVTALLAASVSQAGVYTNSKGQKMSCSKVKVFHEEQLGTGGVTGTAIGGALGGLAGNQFGHGSGKTAATIAGAVGGGLVGHNIGRKHDRYTTTETRCHQVH